MTALDIFHSLIAIFACYGVFQWGVTKWPEDEKRVAMYCWGAHVLGAFAIMSVYQFYYGWGDMLSYFNLGRSFARFVEYDPFRHFPKLLNLLLQRETELPIVTNGIGSSTGSMVALGGIMGLITNSSWAGSVIISTCSAGGQACLWRGVRALVPPERQKQALFSVMLVPSVVFWSSSLLKEAIALMGIGLAVLGLARIRDRKRFTGGALFAAGVYAIGLFKSYILFPLALAVGVYAYWSRAAAQGQVRLRPIALLAGVGLTFALLGLLGAIFPRYSVENVSESIEQQQLAAFTTPGASDYRQSDPSEGPRGLSGMIADAPFSIMTALLRPFFFESRSAMMLVNSVEMTAILGFVIMAFWRTGRVELLRWALRSPDIMASLAFVVSFAFAVGMATTNLGTLSRYRLPMMPFYIYVVASAHALPATLRDARQRLKEERIRAASERLLQGSSGIRP